jgi:hypothetical protein
MEKSVVAVSFFAIMPEGVKLTVWRTVLTRWSVTPNESTVTGVKVVSFVITTSPLERNQ